MAKRGTREKILLESLQDKDRLSTDQVASLLGISPSSARRLFLELEKSGKVVRVFGGIQLMPSVNNGYSFQDFEKRHLAEKRAIAVQSTNLLVNEDIIYLDSGTTLFQFAIAIKEKLQRKELRDIRIITNSFANMEVLSDVCEVILIGGRYRPRRKDFAGYASERFIQCFNYRKTFLGADGFDLENGFSGTDTETAGLNELLLSRSEEVYVLLDSSKICARSFVSFAQVGDVKALVTDDQISSGMEETISQKGIIIIKSRMD